MPQSLSLPLKLAAAVTIGLLTQARAAAQTTYPTTEIPCPTPVTLPDEVRGKTYDCGILTVPENYDDPNGRQIELTYAVLYSQSLSPAPDPVIYLAGGPGGGSILAPDWYAGQFAGHRRTRDVVLFDQRGTEYANRLGCAPVSYAVSEIFNDQDSEYFGQFNQLLEALRDRYPEASEDELFKYAYMAVCGRLLEAHGNDLDQYNTANSTRDVVNLATALGYDDINLYGISYGTYLAQQVLRDHPDRLRSVVLDSTLPQQVNIFEAWVQDYQVILLNLLADCEADAACNQAYPNLKERTIALLEQLSTNPVPLATPIADPMNSDATIDRVTVEQFVAVLDLLNGHPQQVSPYLPLMIYELEQGITTTFASIISGDLPSPTLPEPPTGTNHALTYQQQADELQAKAADIIATTAIQAEQQRPGFQWVVDVQQQAIERPQSELVELLANFYGVGYQAGMPRDRNTLLTFVDENFEGEAAQSLSAAVNALSDIEVRHVYEVVSDYTDLVVDVDGNSTTGMYWSVVCQDIRPLNELSATDAVLAGLEIPQLGPARYASSLEAYAICNTWPVEPSRDAPFAAVKSDIPTLVLQGRYDLATTTAVGPQVMAGLSNGVYVELPNAGHSVMNFSQCAKDIGVAFVVTPDQEPDTSCTADLNPDFVLPSDVAPAVEPEAVFTAPSTNAGPTTYTTVVDDTTLRIEISDGEGFYFRGPLTQAVEGGDYAGLNDWVQVLLNPTTGRVQVVQIGTGEVLFDYAIAGP
jgi:pimeloyl-ACP methyl ester carboxylesterase